MSSFVLLFDTWFSLFAVAGIFMVMMFFAMPFLSSLFFVGLTLAFNLFTFLIAKALFISGMIVLFTPFVSAYLWFG